MIITARHERDDQDIHLDQDQIVSQELELGLIKGSLETMFKRGVRTIELIDGWTLTLFKEDR